MQLCVRHAFLHSPVGRGITTTAYIVNAVEDKFKDIQMLTPLSLEQLEGAS